MDKNGSLTLCRVSLLMASLAAASLVFNCVAQVPDFSAYDGVNLIPEADLTFVSASSTSPRLGWSPDFASGPGPGNRYMTFERVDNSDFGGYTSAGTAAGDLYEAYPDSARLPDGSLPFVYRLEAKNLIANGDQEAAGLTVVTVGSPGYIYDSGAYSNPGTDKYFSLNSGNAATDRFAIDLGAAMVDDNATANYAKSYSLGFKFALGYSGDFFLNLNDNPEDTDVYDQQWHWLRLNNNTINSIFRFPFTTPANSREALLSPRDTNSMPTKYLWFNPSSSPDNGPDLLQGGFDDFQLLSASDDLAIRLAIPRTNSQRPILQSGGRYIVKLWVRTDNTHTYSTPASRVDNRFKASFVSISLHDQALSTSLHGKTVVHSLGMEVILLDMSKLGWTNHASWDNWTELTAYFSDVLRSDQILGADYPLQLTISATNMDSSALRAPGSILIAYPRLYWEANY